MTYQRGDATGSAKHGRALTEAEIVALPDGARIVVTWSGGNGPHEYILRRDERGASALCEWQDDPEERYRYMADGRLELARCVSLPEALQ